MDSSIHRLDGDPVSVSRQLTSSVLGMVGMVDSWDADRLGTCMSVIVAINPGDF